MATSGDILLAIRGGFYMATDTRDTQLEGFTPLSQTPAQWDISQHRSGSRAVPGASGLRQLGLWQSGWKA